MRAMRLVSLLLLGWSGCGGGSSKEDVSVDLAMTLSRDMASNGHLGDPCVDDAQCTTGHCITVAEWPNGPYHVCGQRCGASDGGSGCIEGSCGSTLYGSWCLAACSTSSTCSSKSYCCPADDKLCHPATDCQL